ncbi:MAG: GntR family transcriptional regulator [Trueperaceae bacterium]|nr:GntR family transcriptional regulator [Trueperaceae bacterium]
MSLPDAVSDRLAGRILDGELTAGDRLPGERELAEQLGVSRIVVREALGRLQARGLIEIRPGVGAFVVPMPDHSVTEPLGLYIRRHGVGHAHLFEVRRALEPQIAAAAARRRDPRALATLTAIQRRTAAAAADLARATPSPADDPRDDVQADEALEAFAWADLAFHLHLAQASGNPLFELLLVPLVEPLLEVRRAGARRPGAAERATSEHAAILEAVTAGDAMAAAAAMARHLDSVATLLRPDGTPPPTEVQP